MQYGFYVNTDICTGCKACMTSCFDRNDLEVPQKFRKVYEFGGGDWTTDETGAFTSTAFGYYASMTRALRQTRLRGGLPDGSHAEKRRDGPGR